MSVKFREDKHNGYYATVNGRRITGKTKEIIGKFINIIVNTYRAVQYVFDALPG